MPKVTSYSKVTKKGQITIPSALRKKYLIKAGSSVRFEVADGVLVVRPIRDITSSAGSLSKYARAKDVLKELLREREREAFW